MPTFFVSNNPSLTPPLRLSAEDEHHLVRSLRARAGESVRVTNSEGLVAECEITATRPLVLRVLRHQAIHPPMDITIGLPLIQHERLEWVLEKLTEMNVSRIQLVTTSRCQWHALPDARLQRLTKILRQTQVQCGRAWAVELMLPRTWQSCISGDHQNLLAAHTASHLRPVTSVPLPAARYQHPTLALVGPEGGWADEELTELGNLGFTFVDLGETILRTETAAIVLAARLLSHVTAT